MQSQTNGTDKNLFPHTMSAGVGFMGFADHGNGFQQEVILILDNSREQLNKQRPAHIYTWQQEWFSSPDTVVNDEHCRRALASML